MPADAVEQSRLASVNLAHVRFERWTGSVGRSGIDKRPTTGRVLLADDQVAGDSVCNRRVHGGPDKAVYAYAGEDAAWWSAELGRALSPGAFGENLTTTGLDVTGAVIGELWAIGSAVLEVCCPRLPCSTFAGFWGVPHLVKRFAVAGRPGAYLRIATEGDVGTGDAITVLDRPDHGVTIGETFRALTGDRSLAPRLLEAPQLPAEAHENARRWLGLPV